MVDYTQQKLRSIIYRERKDLDEFGVDNENSLDYAVLRKMETSEITDWPNASQDILNIFNQTYYILTLVFMEKRPVQYLGNYTRIARHTSSPYYDMERYHGNGETFEAIVMAMVYNYLTCFVEKESDIKIGRLLYKIENYFPSSFGSKMQQKYACFKMKKEGLQKYNIEKDTFKPLHVPTEEEVEKVPANDLEELEQNNRILLNENAEQEREIDRLRSKLICGDGGEDISKLRQEVNVLKEQVKAYEEQQQEEINLAQVDFQNKVRLDLLLRLMKRDGADLEKHGNKRRAATIMNIVTGIPLPTCKNYCSEPILSENSHKREIAEINPVLQKLGMQTTL